MCLPEDAAGILARFLGSFAAPMRSRSMISAPRWLPWLALLSLASVGGACSPFDQGEGGVCDINAPNNGSDDCQNGLSCQEAQGARTSPNPYRCCPGDLALATTSVCMLATAIVDASSAPPEAAPPADASEAAALDASAAAPPSEASVPEAAASDGPAE
jgi:hypothetical protein